MLLASITTSRTGGARGDKPLHRMLEIIGVEKRQRRLQRDDHARPPRFRRSAPTVLGHQIVVPGMRANSTVRARVVVHTPCSSDRMMPVATPCWIGMNRTAAIVDDDQREFRELRRQTSRKVETRTILCATNSSTPASAACGTWASRPAAERRKRQDKPRADERAELRDAARLGNHGGARRARIDGKSADQTGQRAGRADAEKIAIDVGLPARGRERRASSPPSAPSRRQRR